MATLATTALTLSDWAKRLDPTGKTGKIIELLSQTNEILDDMLFVEGNLPTGLRTTVRTALPTVTWRMLNAGVLPSKSTTAQIDEQCAMLEAFSQVDKKLVDLNSNKKAFRITEASAFVEAMNQEVAQTVFYGNTGLAQEEFTGLSPRTGAISGAGNSTNVISGSGSGSDNTSIHIVGWGANTVCGVFPKGSKAGLDHADKGEVIIQNAGGVTGALMLALIDHWKWECGLAVRDWRYHVRLCNIDVSNLVSKSAAADLTELMIKGLYRLPSKTNSKVRIYMNRTVAEMLDIQRRDDVIAGGGIKFDNVDGKQTMSFRGIPIKICDQILNTEATVS